MPNVYLRPQCTELCTINEQLYGLQVIYFAYSGLKTKNRTTKHRYSTFHLTTDGAASLSVISCIEKSCDKKFAESVFRDVKVPSFKQESSKNVEAAKLLQSQHDDKIDSHKNVETNDELAKANNNKVKGTTKQLGIDPVSEQKISGILKKLVGIQSRLEGLKQKSTKTDRIQNQNGTDHQGNSTIFIKRKVIFQPHPLQMIEFVNNASTADQANAFASSNNYVQQDGRKADNLDNNGNNHTSLSIKGGIGGDNQRRNQTEEHIYSAGFIKRLRPGERIKILGKTTKNNETVNIIQLVYPKFYKQNAYT